MTTAAVAPDLQLSKRERVIALGVVLFVSLSGFFAGSLLFWLGIGTKTQGSAQLWMGLLHQFSGLLLLWFVLRQRPKGFYSIGLKWEWAVLPRSLGLAAVAYAGYYLVGMGLHLAHYLAKGTYASVGSPSEFFQPSIALVFYFCVSPVFEELIVRGFFMSELFSLTGNWSAAIIASVLLQASYHLYQGTFNALCTVGIFSVFAVYFAKRQRLWEVVLAHFWIDLLATVSIFSRA